MTRETPSGGKLALVMAMLDVVVACSDDSRVSSTAHRVRSDQSVAADAAKPDGAADAGADDGLTAIALDQEGQPRMYFLKVPANIDCPVPVPLVINYHVWDSKPEEWPSLPRAQEQLTHYGKLADREGFIVAYPQGVDGSFNGGTCCGGKSALTLSSSDADNAAFSRAIVADVSKRTCIDPSRIYSIGMSNGGYMSEYNACVNADLFAAVAPVSAMGLSQSACKPSRPISMIAFNGTNDTNNYSGSLQSVKEWLGRNDCKGDPTRDLFGQSYCDTWANCDAGVTVVECVIEGMGHCWPGSSADWPEKSCPTFNDIDATAMSWTFLRNQRLPKALALESDAGP